MTEEKPVTRRQRIDDLSTLAVPEQRPVTFCRLPTGERYLHFGLRATPKVS